MLPDITQLTSKIENSSKNDFTDSINELTTQLSKLILEAKEKDRLHATNLIIDNLLTCLPGGDSSNPLNSLANLILLKLPNAKKSDTELTRKTLIEGDLLLQFPIPKHKILFNENFYKDMEQNASIDKIPQFITDIEIDIKDLISQNAKWTQYLLDLFTIIVSEHDQLANKKNGNETTLTYYVPFLNRCSSQLKIPVPNGVSELYFATNFRFPNIKKYDHTNFTTLFIDYPQMMEEIERFARLVFAHLSVTSGTREAMIDSSLNLEEMKMNAQVLIGAYKKLHDECLHIFNTLNSMTDELERLKTQMTTYWTQKKTDLIKEKEIFLHIEEFTVL